MRRYFLLLVCLAPLCAMPRISSAVTPDWWLIFGGGQEPKREMIYADALSVADIDGMKEVNEVPRSVDVVQVFESANEPSFVAYNIAYQCKARSYKIISAYAHLRSGEVSESPGKSTWTPISQSWLERPYDFVCQASSRKSNSMIKLGSFSTISLPQITREVFWDSQAVPAKGSSGGWKK